MDLQLSVLDQTPIRRGSNAKEALQESIELVKLAEALGYVRYWVSEHHNISTLAGAAPEVLLARLGAETKKIRLGSGGIMLPNHSALKVAENFRLLEALFPGRVDLGIGRAPGGDRLTASLLNPSNNFEPQDYIQQIIALKSFLSDDSTAGTVHEKVKAIPRIDTEPALWMLTSSGESAYLAAHFGLALSFAKFINPVGGAEAVQEYRKLFKPSTLLQTPQTNVGIFAFVGESEETVMKTQMVMDYRLFSITTGRTNEAPSYESVKAFSYTPDEWKLVLFNRQRIIIGTKDQVKHQLRSLAAEYDVNEVVVSTFADTFEQRMTSYELLASIRDELKDQVIEIPDGKQSVTKLPGNSIPI